MDPSRPPGCEGCKEECTIHLTQIINNKIKKIDMCENCPNAKSIQDPNQFNLLSDLISKPPDIDEDGLPIILTCDSCGYTEEKLKRTGRLGCAQCYDTFSESIEVMIANMHKGSSHMGKIPALHQKDSIRRQLVELEKDLQAYIKDENYEEAAKVRDTIVGLKSAMQQE